MAEIKPSDFNKYPWDSVTGNSESETVAHNIMLILIRNGNVFRELSWQEYKKERMNDCEFSREEHKFFDDVIGYCKSVERAILFSPEWDLRRASLTGNTIASMTFVYEDIEYKCTYDFEGDFPEGSAETMFVDGEFLVIVTEVYSLVMGVTFKNCHVGRV